MGTKRVALITGASSGIGAAFAKALAQRQFDLILVARRLERLQKLAASLHDGFGIRTEIVQADLSRADDLGRLVQRVGSLEVLDLLVNNAGFGSTGYFHQTDIDSQRRMHDVHVIATMTLTHAALKGMVARRSGAIINVSSVAASFPSPRNVSYNSTKAWMNNFTEAIHLELRALGIPVRVQALCPGFTQTEFHQHIGINREDLYGRPSFWMAPERVVADSLKGLEKGQWRVIPNWRYRLIVGLVEYLPDFLRQPLLIKARYRPPEEATAPGDGGEFRGHKT